MVNCVGNNAEKIKCNQARLGMEKEKREGEGSIGLGRGLDLSMPLT